MSISYLHRKGIWLWSILGLLTIVLFEAAQQYYYIVRFNLADPEIISFWELFQGQFFRWTFWSLYAIALWKYVQKHPINHINRIQIGRYALVLFILIFFNVITISIFQNLITDGVFTAISVSEYFVFYTFQKSPIYLIAYTVLIAVVHYLISNELIEVQLHQLSKLKETNITLYEELKSKAYHDNTKFIQVKTGNRIKMVPIDSVLWIEADDYCVKIHDESGQSHTIRSSMKVLERELASSNFVRVHRKAIVNKNVVDEWRLGQEPHVLLQNKQKIMIAQSRIKHVKAQFGEPSLAI